MLMGSFESDASRDTQVYIDPECGNNITNKMLHAEEKVERTFGITVGNISVFKDIITCSTVMFNLVARAGIKSFIVVVEQFGDIECGYIYTDGESMEKDIYGSENETHYIAAIDVMTKDGSIEEQLTHLYGVKVIDQLVFGAYYNVTKDIEYLPVWVSKYGMPNKKVVIPRGTKVFIKNEAFNGVDCSIPDYTKVYFKGNDGEIFSMPAFGWNNGSITNVYGMLSKF